MSIKKLPNYSVLIGIIVAMGFMLFPLFALIGNLISGYSTLENIWPNGKALILLLNTLIFSLGVTVLGLLIAIPAASILADIQGRKGQLFRLLAVSSLAVPPYIHALAWQQWFQSLGLPTGGDMVAIWIEALARLPLLVAVILIGFACLDPMSRNATHIYANPAQGFLKITLPQLKTSIIAGSSIVMIFSLTEYGLPALFLRSSYALDIFAQYSATGNSREILLMALPLILISAILAMIAINSLSKLSSPSELGKEHTILFVGPVWFDAWRIIALLIVIFQLIIPFKEVIALTLLTDTPLITKTAIESLKYSSLIAFSASLLSLPLAWFIAEYLHRYPSRIIWLCILIVFALPSSLTGVGSILFWSWTGLDAVYDGQILLVLGYMTKLLPLSILFIYIVIRNSNQLLWDTARIYQNGLKLWLQIRLFQVWPGMVGALLVGFSITLPDLELTLLLSPAGMTSIGVRLFNYLHYGAPEQVAYLVLLILSTTFLFGLGLYLLITGQIKGTKLLKFGRKIL